MNVVGHNYAMDVAYLVGDDIEVIERTAFSCDGCQTVVAVGELKPGTVLEIRCRGCKKMVRVAAETVPPMNKGGDAPRS